MKSSPHQILATKRLMLVKHGKASWVPIRLYSPEDAWVKAGLP